LSDNNTKPIERKTLFTIGHSNMDLNSFVKLLKDNTIEVLVDVRSNPYSRFASHFNKVMLLALKGGVIIIRNMLNNKASIDPVLKDGACRKHLGQYSKGR